MTAARELSEAELTEIAGGKKKQNKPKETKPADQGDYYQITLKPILVSS